MNIQGEINMFDYKGLYNEREREWWREGGGEKERLKYEYVVVPKLNNLFI